MEKVFLVYTCVVLTQRQPLQNLILSLCNIYLCIIYSSTAYEAQAPTAELTAPGEGTCVQTTILGQKPRGQTQAGSEKEVWRLAPATGGKDGYDKAEDWRWVLDLVHSFAHCVFNSCSFIKNEGARVLPDSQNPHDLLLQE